MAIVLVILMFFGFLGVDYWLSRRQAIGRTAPAPAVSAETVGVEPVWAAGYLLPEQLHYHPGHTWVRVLDADTVAVGVDDFARQLLGGASAVDAPGFGVQLKQGGQGFTVRLGGRDARFVSPVEGEVLETNPALTQQPGLVTHEPYGRGWVLKMRVTDLAANLHNLLNGSLARRWMEDARERLQIRLMTLTGTVFADGGEPAADFACHLAEEDWRRLMKEFLLL